MNWKIYISDRAGKQIKKIPKYYADKIKEIIDLMEFNPFFGDIEKMDNKENVWRKRFGSYRIFYEINNSEKNVYILDIKRRTSSTY